MVGLARDCICDSRSEECWKKLWTRVLQIVLTVGITVRKPRSVRVHLHPANAGAVDQSPSDYYQINVYYHLIDHVIGELETRFSSDHEGLFAAQYLIPLYLPKVDQDKVDSLEDYYGNFITREENEHLDVEVAKWKSAMKECQFKRDRKRLIQRFSPPAHKLSLLYTSF